MSKLRKFPCYKGWRACPNSGGFSCKRLCRFCHGKGKVICPDCHGSRYGCAR